MPCLVIHFARFGPYHLTRIGVAAKELRQQGWDVVGLETGGSDATYAWREEVDQSDFRRITVFPGEAAEAISSARLEAGIRCSLDELRPAAVAIAGWGSTDARACLDWCRTRSTTAIVMSETREVDGTRLWWKEWIKSRILQRFDAALVGGRSHRNYLVKLGMAVERIQIGYDVVDNAFFAVETAKWKKSKAGKLKDEIGETELRPKPYFLASNRFIKRKNLGRLIGAYCKYSKRSQASDVNYQWDLCLLGDGELKSELIAQCLSLGLIVAECAPWEVETKAKRTSSLQLSAFSFSTFSTPTVYFPGFRQIEELPRFYARAGCFVHPALEEPWGLVINEAMACGLPVLSGNNVGAAEELVDEGVNGWTYDAGNVEVLAESLINAARLPDEARQTMGAASARILEGRCPTNAFGLGLAQILVR